MREDAQELEHGYATGLVEWLRSEHPLYKPTWEPGYIAIVRWYWEGDAPDSELKILFRVTDRPCLYGMVDNPWEEPGLGDPLYPVTRVVGITTMRWLEGLSTGELPHQCRPDADGVTWLSLWEDW